MEESLLDSKKSKATSSVRVGDLGSKGQAEGQHEPQPGPSGLQAAPSSNRGAAKEADSSEDSIIGILKK